MLAIILPNQDLACSSTSHKHHTFLSELMITQTDESHTYSKWIRDEAV
jgi:hypothetical protein